MSDSLTISHRDRANHARNIINSKTYQSPLMRNSLRDLDAAQEAYLHATVAFSTVATDQTLINVIGTWSRLHRIILQIEGNYK